MYPRGHMARNLLLVLLLAAVRLLDTAEHRLVHFSDTHLPVAGSDATFEKARELVAKADGVVVTGDLTEFGGLDSLQKFDKVFADVKAPFVPTLGNHDATWRSLHDVFWKRYGKNYYAKDAGPFRVLALDSSTCQDPRPHWDPAQLAWVASEAAGASKWLVPSFHHPPWGGEFASEWARARLAVALGRAPVACLLTGHNHNSSTRKWGGLRVVVGGAAQGKDAGFG
ncbi:MAG: metallophosphoesterase, partial [Planctomycetota bacterium]